MSVSRVLIVDDNAEMRLLLRHFLEQSGAVVVSAQNGNEALGLLTEQPNVDLVVTDYIMPGADGMELLCRIRSWAPWKNIPVVMLTGNRDEGDRQRALQSGATAYLFKPFKPRELMTQLRTLFPQLFSQPAAPGHPERKSTGSSVRRVSATQ